MKKTFTTLASLLLVSGSCLTAHAEDFVLPEPSFTVPLNGEAEMLYNMFQITWGYYGLEDNAGDDPITCSLTMPDGTVKTVKGSIDDANMEGTQAGKAPTTENNALSFRNFMQIDMDNMQLIQQYGTYLVNIPEGMVLVNGVPNQEVNLQFVIKGIQEVNYMPLAEMVYPTSQYGSYASAIQLYWKGQDIYFVEDVESMALSADIDGMPLDCTARIVELEGGNEDGSDAFTMSVLYIWFDDFITYMDGTNLSINIPEGIVANDENEVNRAQTVELTLLPSITGTFTPEDNATLESDKAYVTVSWEGESIQPLSGTTVVARNVSSRTDTPVNVTFNDNASITIDLTSLPNGSYEIIIPDAYFLIMTQRGIIQDSYALNTELWAVYTIIDSETSGIENIETENGYYKIYTIDGRPVINTTDVNEVKNLKPGLYIINGNKTLLK